MGSTLPSTLKARRSEEISTPVLRWRCWPLVECPRWSWLAIVGILAVAGAVAYLGSSWLIASFAAVGLAVTAWQYFVPIRYEVGPLGVRQTALGRTRVLPWHSVRAYQLRSRGVVLHQPANPLWIDLLRSVYLPYPPDEDELLCALRQYLAHAVELS